MSAMHDGRHATAVQRLEAALGRIAAPELEGSKVFTAIFAESARREAEAADKRAAAGRSLGLLDGRIVSVKALFDVADTVTSAGSAVLRRLPSATQDAVVLQRLRAAGAVIIGKTQMTEFAFSALGTNVNDGTPGNPRDRRRVPGGSSSGAVVSIIDGMAEIAIGSDTGGSIRIPSALSGAVGFKPTRGRVPTTGAFSLSSSLDTIGPIASGVSDCALADGVLSGGLVEVPSAAATDTFKLTIARGRLFDRCEPAISEAFKNAVRRLRASDVRVEEGSLEPVLDEVAAIDRIGTFPSIEVAATLAGLGISNLDGIDVRTRARIEAGAGVKAIDYVRMVRLRDLAVHSFEASLPENEVFILPTTPLRAPLLSAIQDEAAFHETNGLVLRNPRIANVLDCPSLSLLLPIEGLPAGLMLIGRRHSDRSLLEIAARIELILNQDR